MAGGQEEEAQEEKRKDCYERGDARTKVRGVPGVR